MTLAGLVEIARVLFPKGLKAERAANWPPVAIQPMPDRSVLRDHRPPRGEPVVHANLHLAHAVGLVSDEGRAVTGKRRMAAERHVVVLTLGRPVVSKIELGAVADGPACAGVGWSTHRAGDDTSRIQAVDAGQSTRRSEDTIDRGVAVLEGGATLDVEQRALPGITQATCNGGHPVRPVLRREERGTKANGTDAKPAQPVGSTRSPSTVGVGSTDVALNAEDHPVGELIVVTEFDAAQTAEHPRLVAGDREGRLRELDVGAAGRDAGEAANIESGPPGWRDDGVRGRLHLYRHHGSDHIGRELVTDAGIAGPAVDVVALAIVDANVAEPAGVGNLSRHTQRVLAVGPNPRRR